MPPSNLAALTVLGLALAAGLLAMLVTWARRERRTVLFTSLTAAALALALVIAPTGPSPALWLADKLGHPLRTPGEAAMRLYARIYETERGHAVLAALDGYRSGAASVQIEHYDLTGKTMALTVDVRNTGERGIARIGVDLVGQDDNLAAFESCGRPIIDHTFQEPIWPGDVERITVKWTAEAGCAAGALKEVSERVGAGLGIRVLETSVVDPAERFREDARAWLGL
jgi:hypothetical protein